MGKANPIAMLAQRFLSRVQGSVLTRSARASSSKADNWIGGISMDTELVHGGVKPNEETGAVLTPVFMSTTFVQESVEKYLKKGYSYSRTNNPTVSMLEQKVAMLEGGVGAICTGTGMAATTSCIAAFMNAGDHCVMTNCSYGGTQRIALEQFTPLGMTKHYDGHNIGTGGALISSTQELYERTKLIQNMHGNITAPMTAFLQLQTMKTMGLRVTQQSKSAMKIATFLENHPRVEKCLYPGLASFPQKELADKQHRNGLHGGMLWFDVEGGDKAAIKLMDIVKRPWTLCENLGATESIITACAVMTHANMSREARMNAGISDGFIRISTGIEDPDDLINALDDALNNL